MRADAHGGGRASSPTSSTPQLLGVLPPHPTAFTPTSHFPSAPVQSKGVAPCVRRCLKERGSCSDAATHTQTPPGKAKPWPQAAPTVLGSDALVPCSRRTRKQLTELERADVKPHTGSASAGRAARCQGMLTASSPRVSPPGPRVSPPNPSSAHLCFLSASPRARGIPACGAG